MSNRYPGGFITLDEPTVNSSSAKGVWTLDQQADYQGQGVWPTSTYQISRSLRFNSADTAYLQRTLGTPTSRKTMTYSFWMKKNSNGSLYHTIWNNYVGGNDYGQIQFQNSDALQVYSRNSSGTETVYLVTTALYRDISAWYHFVISIDTTQATSSDRVKIYVNGEQVTSFSLSTYPSQNSDVEFQVASRIAAIGRRADGGASSQNLSAYLADYFLIDGQALTPSDFGETDATTGVWKPKEYTGTYGTNGFHLDFSDNSGTTSTTLGADSSGNGNNWTPNNFSVAAGAGNDSLVDSPTRYGTDTGAGGEVRGNYCTLNPLDTALTGINNGNLNSGTSAAANWKHCRSTLQLTSGKWYWESLVSGVPDGSNGYQTGLLTSTASLTADPNSASTGFYTRQDGAKYTNGTVTGSYFTTTAANDIVMFAFDADAGKLWCGKNGTWEVSGDPAAGTNENWSSVPTNVFPMAGSYGSSLNITVNFGQRPFAYTAPSGFKALCTTNLPEPTVVQGDDYFNTVLWTGDGNATKAITGVGFQPDLVWNKARSSTAPNMLNDAVRGTNKYLSSNTTDAEIASSGTWGYLSSFDSDGFTVTKNGNGYGVNESGATYVAWNWKANGAGSSNTAGSIPSTVSANTTAGISIVTYTGTGTAGTVGHGIGIAPKMIIVKGRANIDQWFIWHTAFSSSQYIYFNTTAVVSGANPWNNTLPTSTLFSLGTDGGVNGNTNTYVAYCFAEVEGFSKFGSYTGNGSADGPFVYTGFKPAFVMIKTVTAVAGGFESWRSWYMVNNAMYPYNSTVENQLWANLSVAENLRGDGSTAGNLGIDLLSNGFKIVRPSTYAIEINYSGATMIYAAFAENPFKNSLAR